MWFIKNLKHSFQNFVYSPARRCCSCSICRNWIQCLLSFYDPFQTSVHQTFPIHSNSCLNHPRQIKGICFPLNLLRTLLGNPWDLRHFVKEEIINQDMMSLWHSFSYSNILDSHPSDISVEFCWGFHQMTLKTMGYH